MTTTLIEVGIDIPNATLLLVEDADRFGLSQLHQLRGRVCRGSIAGECFLFADPLAGPDLLRLARKDAFDLVSADATLSRPEHAQLRRAILERYRDTLDLASIG